MPVKTFTCSKCGDEVTKRKSRLVDGSRICKKHEEAQSQKQKNEAEFIQKMLKQRQDHKRNVDRPRSYSVSKQLTSFALLGSLFKEQQESIVNRQRKGELMLSAVFKWKVYHEFFEAMTARDLTTLEERRNMMLTELNKYEASVLDITKKDGDKTIMKRIFREATCTLVVDLFKRISNLNNLYKELEKMFSECAEQKQIHEDLYAELYPGKREEV